MADQKGFPNLGPVPRSATLPAIRDHQAHHPGHLVLPVPPHLLASRVRPGFRPGHLANRRPPDLPQALPANLRPRGPHRAPPASPWWATWVTRWSTVVRGFIIRIRIVTIAAMTGGGPGTLRSGSCEWQLR